MKNLLVYYDPDLTTTLEDIPIPSYGDDEVLIKVHVAGSNPKDWKHPMPNYFNVKVNQGDDVGGVVEAVGAKVRNFRTGDRVAGFHVMDTPRGTYAEYTVCPENTVFHIPERMSFEEAATIPLAAFTAAVGLYRNLRLPLPFERSDVRANTGANIPLIINGAASAVGAFAVKLAKLNPRISPIIGIAGSSAAFAHDIGCDVVLDYRSPSVAQDILAALQPASADANGGVGHHHRGELQLEQELCCHVFDAANSVASLSYLLPALSPIIGRYTCTTGVGAGPGPGKGEQEAALRGRGVWFEQIWVGSVHDDEPAGGKLFGAVMSRVFEELLEGGERFGGHRFEVVEGGLGGVRGALERLRERKGGNAKFVCRVGETEGVGG